MRFTRSFAAAAAVATVCSIVVLRALHNGSVSAFQAEGAGSIPAARSTRYARKTGGPIGRGF